VTIKSSFGKKQLRTVRTGRISSATQWYSRKVLNDATAGAPSVCEFKIKIDEHTESS